MLNKFANETSLHGIPKVIVSRSDTRRYIWASVCLLFGLMCIAQVIEVLRRFSEYPTRTNVELVVNEPFPFPSVSVCHTRNLDFLVLNTINRLFIENEHPMNHVNFTDSHFVREYMKMFDKYCPLWYEYQDKPEYRAAFEEVFSRTTISANIPEEVISSAAIQFNDFFVKCLLGGNRCNSSADFSTFFDSYYYNCFTYTAPEVDYLPVSGMFYVKVN